MWLALTEAQFQDGEIYSACRMSGKPLLSDLCQRRPLSRFEEEQTEVFFCNAVGGFVSLLLL